MNEFEQLVNKMRIAQKNYFKTRDKYWLKKSKEIESQVDKHIADITNPEINF
jgi:hypothetical protein